MRNTMLRFLPFPKVLQTYRRTLGGSRQTRDSGESVKSRIKAQDLIDSLGFHDGQVHRVASGHADKTHHDFLRPLRSSLIDSKDLINYVEQSVKRRLYRIATIYGRIPVQDLLKDLGIGYEAFAITCKFLEQALCIGFVWVRCPD